MAAPKPRDPLDALQVLLNDVLVQTGKALRASRRDGQGNLALPQGLSQSKLPVTIDAFHKALDDLESDIIQAKSVILRDLNQIQADKPTSQQQQLQPALPIESQTKEPISIDMESSPAPSMAAHTKPAPAPFPVMDAGSMNNGDNAIKTEDNAPSANNAATNNIIKTEAPMAPEAPMMADANFTDMEFSLAPGDGPQGQNGAEASFDLSSFAPGDTMLSLENLLPNNGQPDASTSNNGGAAAAPMTTTTTGAQETKTEPAKDGTAANPNDSNFDDFFTHDASQADGMDFDFSLGGGGGGGTGGGTGGGNGGGGGGMGEDTFDDLMNDRDGGFELMSNADFDAAFFDLDNKDGTS